MCVGGQIYTSTYTYELELIAQLLNSPDQVRYGTGIGHRLVAFELAELQQPGTGAACFVGAGDARLAGLLRRRHAANGSAVWRMVDELFGGWAVAAAAGRGWSYRL